MTSYQKALLGLLYEVETSLYPSTGWKLEVQFQHDPDQQLCSVSKFC